MPSGDHSCFGCDGLGMKAARQGQVGCGVGSCKGVLMDADLKEFALTQGWAIRP